jgi:hypothetical protein
MVSFDRERYDWRDDADPGRATMAFLSGVDHDPAGTPLARLELTDDEETVLGYATVTGEDLPGAGEGALRGTSVFDISVTDGRLVDVTYDPEASEAYQEALVDRIERLADDE